MASKTGTFFPSIAAVDDASAGGHGQDGMTSRCSPTR